MIGRRSPLRSGGLLKAEWCEKAKQSFLVLMESVENEVRDPGSLFSSVETQHSKKSCMKCVFIVKTQTTKT